MLMEIYGKVSAYCRGLLDSNRYFYDCVINDNGFGIFFIDEPDGYSKIYLYNCLLAYIRSKGFIALTTASSDIASLLMPGGRTAHFQFKILLITDENTLCNFTKQKHLAQLLHLTKLIIWNKISIINRQAIETLNQSLKDIMKNNLLFGCKIFVFGGNFQQVLLVIPQETCAQIVNTSFKKSYLWSIIEIFYLYKNMRVENNDSSDNFVNLLLKIGNRTEQTINEDMIKIPDQIVVP
ncbi:24251_t:CDS:2 [Gigaspora margarita]|uniref:ATP-dependent DNA helicase n=1 Tax=Gigaspora margarita TaxID=4874 RepID=A0ABN7VBJ8_GIGMA|nr:24251_t:CDS:2 [Gigaspora margarita]